MESKKLITFSNAAFVLGIIIGLAVAITSLWADYEAVGYFFTGQRFDPFHALHCPVWVTRGETATISATLKNPTDKEVNPYYRVEISGPLGREFKDQIKIAPNETVDAKWTVNSENIDLRFFILSKVTILPYAGLPAREATCGIFVLNLNVLKGIYILIAAIVISLLGMIGGLRVWESQMEIVTRGFMQPKRVRRALAIVIILAMVAGLLGWWAAGIILLPVSTLLLVISILFR